MLMEWKSTQTRLPAVLTRYSPGTVIYAKWRYDNEPETVENRPAVVLHDHREFEDEMMIILPGAGEDAEIRPFDVPISWRAAGLSKPTRIRADRPRTIPKNVVVSVVGHVSPKDWYKVREAFKKVVNQIP